jgi:XTP/dITP diphosphohydrolase
MEQVLLCSGNPGKIVEMRALLASGTAVLGLADVGLPNDLPETGATFQENALQKARHAHAHTGLLCVADDSGLEVDALHGAPGVYSARYAGAAKDAAANMAKLLRELEGVQDRRARFRTVVALVGPQGEHCFTGSVEGRITTAARGTGGFGYDPVFEPEGSTLTFAEMDAVAKNAMSHRGQAMRALTEFLNAR